MKEFWFEIPMPPSINRRIALRYKPKEHAEAFELARLVSYGMVLSPLAGSISVSFYMQFMDRRTTDLMNRGKETMDGFTKGGLWGDDSQIDEAYFYRLPYLKGAPKLYIHVKEIGPMCGIDVDKARDKLKK